MRKNVFAVGLVLFFSGAALAQEGLIGKYSGNFVVPTRSGDRALGLTLEIASLQGDAVKGKAFRGTSGQAGPGCKGEYPVEGTVKGNALQLRSSEAGGPSADCRMTLRLTVEGNKLVGTMNQFKAELSK